MDITDVIGIFVSDFLGDFELLIYGYMLGEFDLYMNPEEEGSPYLDKMSFIRMWRDRLPHWEQLDKIQFITFRLADSLPQSKLRLLQCVKSHFMNTHPKPWDDETLKNYKKTIAYQNEKFLDAGYGCCAMRDAEMRKFVSDAIEYHDGKEYDLLAYVVMPNHVHCLVKMNGDNEANDVMLNVKRFSARLINKVKGKGYVRWSQSWDRLVRNRDHLLAVAGYIYDNPAHLGEDEYTIGGMMLKDK